VKLRKARARYITITTTASRPSLAQHHHDDNKDTIMVNERPKQFGGVNRFGGPVRPGFARPAASSGTVSASPSQARAQKLGLGLGKGSGGLGKGKGLKRHMFVLKGCGWDIETDERIGRFNETRFMGLRRVISGK